MIDNAKTIAELRTKLPPFKDAIGKISCRTLVVNGEQSAVWLRRIGELSLSCRPQQRGRLTIPDSRHFPHMENAPEFNKQVARQFHLKGRPSDSQKTFQVLSVPPSRRTSWSSSTPSPAPRFGLTFPLFIPNGFFTRSFLE